MRLFHLTAPENVAAILAGGIRASAEEGCIYAFTDMIVANTIARDQVLLKQYAVFEIAREGVRRKPGPDRVAELSAGYHRVIRQRRIAAPHIHLVGTFDVIHDRPTEWDYLRGARCGLTATQVDAAFAWSRGEITDEEATHIAGFPHSGGPKKTTPTVRRLGTAKGLRREGGHGL